MWITMTAFAKESPCARYVLEEAVVKILPVYSYDSNFVHREFEWLCETKEYVVQYCSTSEKVDFALGVFRLRNFQFVAERWSGIFVSVIFITFSVLTS